MKSSEPIRASSKLPQAVESLIKAQTSEAMFIVDPAYRIVYWDSQVEALTGFSLRR